MKRVLLPLLLISSAVVGAHAASISWKRTYSIATAEAKSTGKLVMIDFYTDWCGWCKKLDSDTYPAPAVVKESERFVPIKLNAEKDADGIRLAKKFSVSGYPTILFIDSHENLVYKIVGYEAPKEFATAMSKAATIRQDRARFGAELKANPNNFDGLIGMASIEASTGDAAAAAGYVGRAPTSVSGPKRAKLLDAYNAVGDGFQNSNKFDKAITYFMKAVDPEFSDQTAYARISIAECYAQAGTPKLAVPFLKALISSGAGPKEYLDQAKAMLAQIDK